MLLQVDFQSFRLALLVFLTLPFALIGGVAGAFLGGGVIHDFAFALCFGVLVGTYSSMFIASPILVWWYERRIKDKKRMALDM